MEFEQIKELIALVESSQIAELEIRNEGFRIRIRKKEALPVKTSEKTADVVVAQDPLSSDLAPPPQDNSNCVKIVAPMVGTFYRAPAPDAPPYVRVGERIEEGQVLFIIEAMKMMNEIESELAGTVKEILVENGMPVEYGEPLLLIELPG